MEKIFSRISHYQKAISVYWQNNFSAMALYCVAVFPDSDTFASKIPFLEVLAYLFSSFPSIFPFF
uniref:Uncharacterized protein n=1 Tax=Megaselia scalaris TaxID=36166 RepID=T1GLC3_MEGSC